MSYTFVKITTYYKEYLEQYYTSNPEIPLLNYEQQLSHLHSQCYSWANFFATHLNELGINAHEIVSNAIPLQQTWALEKSIPFNEKNVVVEQLKRLKAEVVFFQDSVAFNGNWVRELKSKVPSIKLLIGWCCSPISNEVREGFRDFDVVLVCLPKFYDEFKSDGFSVYRLNHAFESSIVDKLSINNRFTESEFIFLGSIIAGSDYHDLRKVVLNKLIQSNVNVEVYANIPYLNPVELKLRQAGYIASRTLNFLGLHNLSRLLPFIKKANTLKEMPCNPTDVDLLKAVSKQPIYALEMLKALSKSKIGFNIHGDIAGDNAGNIRLFEVTGVGTCLLTDHKKNIRDFFEPDKEIVTYSSANDCIEKIKWLLDNPKEREAIAKAGQQRTLRDHNFKVRAELLDEIIRKHL